MSISIVQYGAGNRSDSDLGDDERDAENEGPGDPYELDECSMKSSISTELRMKRRQTVARNSKILVAGDDIRTFADELYAKLRVAAGIYDDFLDKTFCFKDLKSSGGKGGDLLGFTSCGGFIVKALNEADHLTLLEIEPDYVNLLLTGQSMMVLIVLHFEDSKTSKKYMVMRNCLPHFKKWDALYDLKGCADDKVLMLAGKGVKAVSKRIWNLHLWIGSLFWSKARRKYYHSKKSAYDLVLDISPEQLRSFKDVLERDVAFLKRCGLMDYSLLLGIKNIPESAAHKMGWLFKESSYNSGLVNLPMPFVTKVDDHYQITYLSIIDFLSSWNWKKKVAKCIKTFESDKATIHPQYYAQRFETHFLRVMRPLGEDVKKAPKKRDGSPSPESNSKFPANKLVSSIPEVKKEHATDPNEESTNSGQSASLEL